MTLNIIPTEQEIEIHAARVFPDNKEFQSSFIQGVWRTIYKSKIKKKNIIN